jgi:hypothetical protein
MRPAAHAMPRGGRLTLTLNKAILLGSLPEKPKLIGSENGASRSSSTANFYVFQLPDGHRVTGQDLRTWPYWPWRDSLWLPGIQYA